MTAPARQSVLVDRLRVRLASEPSTREIAMFGGRCFMVNDKMIVSALKAGDLLVRVSADEHDELTTRPGATQAEMGPGRTMGPGWIAVAAQSVDSDADLAFWLDRAMDHNRATARLPR